MMRGALLLATIGGAVASNLVAQQPDTTTRHDTAHATEGVSAVLRAPTLGATADFLVDVSPVGSTLASARRFELREIQMSMGAGIDRYVRGDIVLSLDDAQQLSVMEAALSSVGLPWQLQIKAGRFHLPFGKQNTIHRAHLPTIDYPLIIRRFLGSQGGMGTGLGLNKAFDLLGFGQELQLTVIEQFPDDHGHDVAIHDHEGIEGRPASPASKTLQGLGYTARLRNSWSAGAASQIELALSAGTGKHAHPFGCGANVGHPIACPGARGETGVNARRSLLGADVSIRFRSSSGERGEWLLLQSEVMRLHNELPALPLGAPDTASYLGPTAEETGAYVFARWRVTSRVSIGTRLDWLELNDAAARDLGAVSGHVQLGIGELTKLTAAYERIRPEFGRDMNRFLVQAVLAIGALPAHPF